MSGGGLGWPSIVRLGLVQSALGAVVVMTTSTLNRVMVVELMLPAMLPGALVAFHYALQFLRPRWGWGSDMGGRRSTWIVGGICVLAAGGILAAMAVAWMGSNFYAGLALAVFAFLLIGIGVGAGGTSLLALVATHVADHRRAAAATIVWMMMIAGFAVTANIAGHFLDPYSPARLVEVTSAVSLFAVAVTVIALWGIERRGPAESRHADPARKKAPFQKAFREVWSETETQRFAIFVFVSMLAYSAQDLILEPFSGHVFGLTPGESTKLAGVQHGGVFLGMLLVGVAGSVFAGTRLGSLRLWTIGGCLSSAVALAGIAASGFVGPDWPLRGSVFYMGVSNGAFAVAAIGSMMALAARGHQGREGLRMGVWGAAQAVAFGLGGFLGTAAADAARALYGEPLRAYSTVFAIEAVLFLVSAWLATRIRHPESRRRAAGKTEGELAVAATDTRSP